MTEANELSTQNKIQWCPGCGDFGILAAAKSAISQLGLNPWEVVIVSGIGCSSKIPHYIKTYGFEGVHGRTLPVATGIRLSNHKLTVIAMAGDGDGYGIGMSHFIHTAKRNMNITYIVFNNSIYGLTKGQASPTTAFGRKTSSTPHGNPERPLSPLALAITAGATFVARSFAGDVQHLSEMMKKAIMHKGFSFIDVLQPCVSWNPDYTYEWYKEKIYRLGPEYDPFNKAAAVSKALQVEEKIATGIFFIDDKTPSYEETLEQISEKPLFMHDISNVDIERALDALE